MDGILSRRYERLDTVRTYAVERTGTERVE
jgi:hypothetical protein